MIPIKVTKQQHGGYLCHQLQKNRVLETSRVMVVSACHSPGTETSRAFSPSKRASKPRQPFLK